MNRVELSLANAVAVPLADKLTVLVEMNHSGSADIVRRILGIGVIGTFVRVAFADINVAVLTECDHHGLPKQSLLSGFVPISSVASHADSHEKFAVGGQFHYGGAIGVGDPDVVFRIDGHAMRFFLMTDNVITDL